MRQPDLVFDLQCHCQNSNAPVACGAGQVQMRDPWPYARGYEKHKGEGHDGGGADVRGLAPVCRPTSLTAATANQAATERVVATALIAAGLTHQHRHWPRQQHHKQQQGQHKNGAGAGAGARARARAGRGQGRGTPESLCSVLGRVKVRHGGFQLAHIRHDRVVIHQIRRLCLQATKLFTLRPAVQVGTDHFLAACHDMMLAWSITLHC